MRSTPRRQGQRPTRRASRPEPPADLRFYDLRHTCASLLIREGASIKAVQRHMGHKTAAITLDTYGHLYPNELAGLAERFERLHVEASPGSRERWPAGRRVGWRRRVPGGRPDPRR